jgi:hypothetical protein
MTKKAPSNTGVGLVLLAAAALMVAALDSRGEPPIAGRSGKSGSTLDAGHTLSLTCVQAWSASGRRYPQMIAIVTTLAKVSLANRNLTFPNTREAGLDAGRGIADDCKADPDALLFAIVDKHVRRVAKPEP